jgi:hypothetical protein
MLELLKTTQTMPSEYTDEMQKTFRTTFNPNKQMCKYQTMNKCVNIKPCLKKYHETVEQMQKNTFNPKQAGV